MGRRLDVPVIQRAGTRSLEAKGHGRRRTVHADKRDEVRSIQQALKEHGFNPGSIDGVYGQGTVATVIAFQKSDGLLPDGVAGPRTMYALGLATSSALPSQVGGVTIEIVSQIFPRRKVMKRLKEMGICLSFGDMKRAKDKAHEASRIGKRGPWSISDKENLV
jgi:Putative peptidoglycan binding domain